MIEFQSRRVFFKQKDTLLSFIELNEVPMLNALKTSRFILTVIMTAGLCVACDNNDSVSQNSSDKSDPQTSSMTEEAVISTPPAESISFEALEQQLSPLHNRILELENELEAVQQAAANAMNKKEDERFEQSVMEKKIHDLQSENQELSNQLTAQEETIQQLQNELSEMNAQHQEELAKQSIPPQTD